MPFALLLFGIVLIVAGVRGKESDLFALLQKDFTGPNNFTYWAVVILILGMVGYVPKLRTLANSFLVLLLLVLFLNKKGFFAQFQNAIETTSVAGMTNTQGVRIS